MAPLSTAVLATNLIARAVPIALLDTCSLLDIIRAPVRQHTPTPTIEGAQNVLAAAQSAPPKVSLVVATQVMSEWTDHHSGVTAEVASDIRAIEARLAAFQAAHVLLVPEFGWPGSPFTQAKLEGRLFQLAQSVVGATYELGESKDAIMKAAARTMMGTAPASKGKQEFKDCAIIEHYLDLAGELRQLGFSQAIYFVTSNSRDYGPPNAPRAPLATEFAAVNIQYLSSFAWLNSKL